MPEARADDCAGKCLIERLFVTTLRLFAVGRCPRNGATETVSHPFPKVRTDNSKQIGADRSAPRSYNTTACRSGWTHRSRSMLSFILGAYPSRHGPALTS